MTQIAGPQVLSTHRRTHALIVAALATLAVTIALTVLLATSPGHHSAAAPVAQAAVPAADAGPASDTPAAVSQAVGIDHVRPGLSLSTNVPAPVEMDAGPASGTPAAVSQALAR